MSHPNHSFDRPLTMGEHIARGKASSRFNDFQYEDSFHSQFDQNYQSYLGFPNGHPNQCHFHNYQEPNYFDQSSYQFNASNQIDFSNQWESNYEHSNSNPSLIRTQTFPSSYSQTHIDPRMELLKEIHRETLELQTLLNSMRHSSYNDSYVPTSIQSYDKSPPETIIPSPNVVTPITPSSYDTDDDHYYSDSPCRYINSEGDEILCFGLDPNFSYEEEENSENTFMHSQLKSPKFTDQPKWDHSENESYEENHNFIGDIFFHDHSVSSNIQPQWDHSENESYQEDPDSLNSLTFHLIPPFDIPNDHPIDESHIHKSYTHTIGTTLENLVIPQKLDQSFEPLIDDNKCILIGSFVQNIDPQYDFNSISQFELEDMIYDSDTPIIPHPHESHVKCLFSNIDQVDMEPICQSNPTLCNQSPYQALYTGQHVI